MQTIKVKEGQTSLDIAMQYCGDATIAYAIANNNNKSVTDDLILDEQIVTPDADVSMQNNVDEFFENGLVPASAITQDLNNLDGIGYWIIEQDFVVQ